MQMIDTLGYEPKIHVAGVCEVVRVRVITPHMRRITLHGKALKGLESYWRPEMLIRLYFPPKESSNPPEPFLTPEGELEFKTTGETEVSPFSAFSERSPCSRIHGSSIPTRVTRARRRLRSTRCSESRRRLGEECKNWRPLGCCRVCSP